MVAPEFMAPEFTGRQIPEVPRGYELRERVISYMSDFDSKKGDIGPENTYEWNLFE